MLKEHPGFAAGCGCAALFAVGLGLLILISWVLAIAHQWEHLVRGIG